MAYTGYRGRTSAALIPQTSLQQPRPFQPGLKQFALSFVSEVVSTLLTRSRKLGLNFLGGSPSTLDPRITFTRADATSCATYFDSTGRLQTAAANVPRFDYDPTSVIAQNLCQQSESLPNYQLVSGSSNGITIANVGSGTDANGPYSDYRISGTATGAAFPYVRFVQTAITPISVGMSASCGFTAKVIAGSSPKNLVLSSQGLSIADAFTETIGVSKTIAQDGSTQFYSTTGSPVNATTARFNFLFTATYAASDVVDVTVRIWRPQANYGSTLLAYYPTTGTPYTQCAPRGLLIEESRTNLLNFSNSWGNNGGASAATQVQNAVGPDGTTNSAYTVTESATLANQYGFAGNTATLTAVVNTASAFVKAGTKNIVQLCVSSTLSTDYANFTLSGNGTINQATTPANCTITPLGSSGWYRISMSFTSLAAAGNVVVGMINATTDTRLLAYTGTGKTIIVYGAQLELGAFPTSYIPTTTSTVTRWADSAVMTGTNFSSWFNYSAGVGTAAGPGTFVVEGDAVQKAAQQSFCTVDNGTLNERIEIAINSAGFPRTQVLSGGVSQADLNGGTTKWGVVFKETTAYAAADFRQFIDGVSGGTSVTGTTPTVDRLVIGNRTASGVQLNGHIRRIAYYNTRLPDAVLQALTK